MRERYIDILKGFSIICITLLHYTHNVFPKYIDIYIGSFMITTFYIVSGWVSARYNNKKNIKELIKKRWRQLGIPYLWWTTIILLFDIILFLFGHYNAQYIGIEIYKTLTLRGIGTLWFLPALFGGEIIWLWLKNKNNFYYILFALIIAFLYKYYYNMIFIGKIDIIYRIIDAPFRTINNIMESLIGIIFGFYSYFLLKNILFKNPNIKLFLIGIFISVLAFITANYLPKQLSIFWFFFAPMLGPLGLIFLFKSIQSYKILDFFNFWGHNSLNLMVTHYSITLVLFNILVEKGLGKPFDGFVTLLCFFLSMPIQYLLVKLIDKYAKFTLGK